MEKKKKILGEDLVWQEVAGELMVCGAHNCRYPTTTELALKEIWDKLSELEDKLQQAINKD